MKRSAGDVAYCLGLPIGVLVANGLLMFCEMCRRKGKEREGKRGFCVLFSREVTSWTEKERNNGKKRE